jgi:hypothetical protein
MDIGLPGSRLDRFLALERAVSLGFDDFTFRVKVPHDLEFVDTVRVDVAIAYCGRGFQTIQIDLGPADEPAVDLVPPTIKGVVELGIRVTSPVRCITLDVQVAQKLHACTNPRALQAENRARDILRDANVRPLPVICAVGINYTQNGRCSMDGLFRYEEPTAGVVRSTASSAAVVSVVAAYQRNRNAWTSRKAVDPESPVGFYGSPDATSRIGPIAKGCFILVITNICPFITMTEWAKVKSQICCNFGSA